MNSSDNLCPDNQPPLPINGFEGEFRFLSNFYPSVVKWDKKTYPTVEHAYQAAKTNIEKERSLIRKEPSPGRAKRLGKKVTLRKDWENIKLSVMHDLILQKFSTDENLKQQLLSTGGCYLEETNSWGDTYWGVCDGIGKNILGKILMQVRSKLTPIPVVPVQPKNKKPS